MINEPWNQDNLSKWKTQNLRADDLPKEQEFDVIVIGSGAGGGVTASRLAALDSMWQSLKKEISIQQKILVDLK